MSSPGFNELSDCIHPCRSVQHGDIITAAISKRSISDMDLCSFLNYTCMSCESIRDSVGRTALHVAASCGRVDLVRWLVKNRHADIDCKDKESGYTALHRSIFYGKIHVAVELIKLGASVAALDSDSLTAIEHAVKDGLKPMGNHGGELYSWGSNVNNSLGPQQARETAELLDVFHKEYPYECVQQICVDQFHSVIVTNAGKAYSCGHGQGGRLGVGTEKTIVTPNIINFAENIKGETVTCLQASISRDHSMFLCSDGNVSTPVRRLGKFSPNLQVFSCGLNTFRVLGHQPPPERLLVPTQLKHISSDLQGICVGRYHSVAWSPSALYTWGLNAGQLGHKTNGRNEEHYVTTPKIVKMINIGDSSIETVAASDGATAVCTKRGDIYVLHEYQCRRIASRQLNIIQISIIGGKLVSPSLNQEASSKLKTELKVVALTNTGNILLWQESDSQLCRCIFSINRAMIIKQVSLNINEILFVTDNGEAFKGYICQRKKRLSTVMDKNPKNNEKSAFHRFLDKEDCILVQLKKICKIHRAISIQSDPKGKDYCIVQAYPYKSFEFPEIVESEMQTHFQILLDKVHESDDIHDIIFKVDSKYFPAHSFIVSSKSRYIEKLIQDEEKSIIALNDINPDIFEQLLLFIYTGTCDLIKCGELTNENLRKLCDKQREQQNIKDREDEFEIPDNMSAYEYYKKTKPALSHIQHQTQKSQNIKNPVRMLQEVAKKFECKDLQKILNNLEMQKYLIRFKQTHEVKDIVKPIKFDRFTLPDLYDVTIKCRDNRELKAHKCILAARLEYFNNMFSMRWRGSETSEISLAVPKSIAEALLEFLYTDSLSYLNNVDTEHLFKVLVLADQLLVARLKEQCEMLLTNMLTLKNATHLLSFAHLYNAEKLKECCMKFIVLNMTPFLELRSLDDLEEELVRELTDFYFQEKQEIWCRVITPYSTAPLDEEIISISNLHPVSLEDEFPRTTPKTSQKRKSRPHRSSLSEKHVSISLDNDFSLDGMIQFPDIPEVLTGSKKDIVILPDRLRSITLASEKIKVEAVDEKFTRLSSNRNSCEMSGISTSFNESRDFPELNSPPSHTSGNFLQRITTTQKPDSKHKLVKLSQKQRKRLSSESNNQVPQVVSGSPKNPWKIIPDISSPTSSFDSKQSIGDIISDEKKQKENLVKITTKLLSFTQIEDKAIDELHRFYNSDTVTDEIITIERVSIGAIASPVWVPRK